MNSSPGTSCSFARGTCAFALNCGTIPVSTESFVYHKFGRRHRLMFAETKSLLVQKTAMHTFTDLKIENLFTFARAAETLGVSLRQFRRLIDSGKLLENVSAQSSLKSNAKRRGLSRRGPCARRPRRGSCR